MTLCEHFNPGAMLPAWAARLTVEEARLHGVDLAVIGSKGTVSTTVSNHRFSFKCMIHIKIRER
jgi:hypothetical protein